MNRDKNQIVEFTLLFNKYKKRLFNYVLKMSSDRMQTDDIVQDVFIKLYQNLDLIRNKDSILAWLFRSVRNELYSLYRNTKLKKLYVKLKIMMRLKRKLIFHFLKKLSIEN